MLPQTQRVEEAHAAEVETAAVVDQQVKLGLGLGLGLARDQQVKLASAEAQPYSPKLMLSLSRSQNLCVSRSQADHSPPLAFVLSQTLSLSLAEPGLGDTREGSKGAITRG